MKYLIQYCSLFLCCVVLFLAFSPVVNAESKTGDYKIIISPYEKKNGVVQYLDTYQTFDLDEWNSTTFTLSLSDIQNPNSYKITYGNQIYISKRDNSLLLKKGLTSTFTLSNFLFYSNFNGYESYSIEDSRMLAYYDDGTTSYLTGYSIKTNNNNHTVSISLTPSKNIKKIEFHIWHTRAPSTTYSYIYKLGYFNGATYGIDITQQSEESGLLKSIIEWLKGIKDGITNLFTNITEGFTNIGQWFAELPSKLWAVISEGLKNLFIPDEEFMVDYKSEWEELLSDRLGCVYQVCDLVLGVYDWVKYADQTDTIEIPRVDIELPDYNYFSFGGYEVRVVPEPFVDFAEWFKMFVGIVCTLLFINGLIKRYDEIMGVEQ